MDKHRWVVEVLGDVAAYAKLNGMRNTYDALVSSMITANEEVLVESSKCRPKFKNNPNVHQLVRTQSK